MILLVLFGLIAIICIVFFIKNTQTLTGPNDCKKLCHDLFKNSKGVTYEDACNNACNAGIKLNKQEQCDWCSNNQAPMSGYNIACQKYINLNHDKTPNNIYKSECCGKGGFKNLC